MCRSTVEGGRRCALHSPGGFVATRIARAVSGLDARQVNASFHVLRVEGARANEPTREQWAQWLQEQAAAVESQELHGRTVSAIRTYITQAADDTPDGPTFYAMRNLCVRAQGQNTALFGALNRLALANQVSMTEMRRQFNTLRAEASVRNNEMPSGYSARTFSAARSAGLPLDTPTIHALGTLNDLGEQVAQESEPRIRHQSFSRDRVVSSAGYDPEADRRLEIRFLNADGSASSVIHAYRNVPAHIWANFQEDPIRTYNTEIRGRSEFLYSTVAEARRDGVRRRCSSCGQFAAMSHSCPRSDGPRPTRQPRTVAAPSTDEITRLNRAQERLAEEGQELVSPSQETDAPYDLDDLQRHISLIQEEHLAGEPILKYDTENVTGGLCSPDGGMGFGVEIEFMPTEYGSISRISQALYDAGLTQSEGLESYHTARESGWEAWSLEEDTTVGAELVSPIMYDTPEHWEQLRQVCEIIKNNGGYVSEHTGGHVHISSSALGTSVAKHAELVNLNNEHEDVMFRIGTEPGGVHRTTHWCAPNWDATQAYNPLWGTAPEPNSRRRVSMESYRAAHAGHNRALNISDSGHEEGAHVEFRAFDGSLDPAVIQTRILVSAAMVQRASQHEGREPTWNNLPTQRERKRVGHHHALPDEQQHDGFLDFQTQLFSRDEDRLRVTRLYGVTRWQHDLPTYDASLRGFDFNEDENYQGDIYFEDLDT